jgi:hypothetical protein
VSDFKNGARLAAALAVKNFLFLFTGWLIANTIDKTGYQQNYVFERV